MGKPKYIATVRMEHVHRNGKRVEVFGQRVDMRNAEDRDALAEASRELAGLSGDWGDNGKQNVFVSGKPFRRRGFHGYQLYCRHCYRIRDDYHNHPHYCSDDCRIAAQNARRAAVKRAKRAENRKPRKCEHCRETFQPKRNDARFCSAKCRVYASRVKA